MISPDWTRAMAAYNAWQNRGLYAAADGLDDAARRAPRGAFFGSIHATLNHLLWADQIWMHRLAGTAAPTARSIAESVAQHADWEALKAARAAFDDVVLDWAERLDAAALAGDLAFHSASAGRRIVKPRWLLVTHMFNHQTHHRGQVHAMLTAAGARPGDSDLPLMPG